MHPVDLRDRSAVVRLIENVQPDQIYHLAAQAAVGASFGDPWDTYETNIRSQLNLFDACIQCQIRPRIMVVSSGEVYSSAAGPDAPATEDTPFQPTSPYSVSKIAQEMIGVQYHQVYDFPVIRVRPFNQIGPGQREGFVAPDFAMQIARIEAGQQPPIIRVGNLEARRDFTDVRDVVRAKYLLMQHGVPGAVYNIASGIVHKIRDILELLLAASPVTIQVEPDPARMRPARVPLLWGDASRLRKLTGWQPTIAFDQSLRDVLDDCRQRITIA